MKNKLKSAEREIYNLRTLISVAMLIACSAVIESFTINLSDYVKINFAFIPLAVIGMIAGPFVGLFAGMVCDITGYIAHPQGAYFFTYTLIGGLQGLIYGSMLYYKFSTSLHYTRIVIARILDILIINIWLNTQANIYHGFIPKIATREAIIIRVAKNVLEFFADVPLMFAVLPVALMAYIKIFRRQTVS